MSTEGSPNYNNDPAHFIIAILLKYGHTHLFVFHRSLCNHEIPGLHTVILRANSWLWAGEQYTVKLLENTQGYNWSWLVVHKTSTLTLVLPLTPQWEIPIVTLLAHKVLDLYCLSCLRKSSSLSLFPGLFDLLQDSTAANYPLNFIQDWQNFMAYLELLSRRISILANFSVLGKLGWLFPY